MITDADKSFADRFGEGVKASAFTGKAEFYEAYNFLQDILKSVQKNYIEGGTTEEVANKRCVVPWLHFNLMSERMGFNLEPLQYRKICSILTDISNHAHIPEIRDFISVFSRASLAEINAIFECETKSLDTNNSNQNSLLANRGVSADGEVSKINGNDFENIKFTSLSLGSSKKSNNSKSHVELKNMDVNTDIREQTEQTEQISSSDHLLRRYSHREPRPAKMDTQGRVVGVGRRKSAVAHVYMIPGSQNLFYVNGIPVIEYFPRLHDIFRLSEPFTVAGAYSQFNTWCTVQGGGSTGQSGAIAHGLAKALVFLKPGCRNLMIKWGLLHRDPRTVERKKPGQPKARKKFTWVKR